MSEQIDPERAAEDEFMAEQYNEYLDRIGDAIEKARLNCGRDGGPYGLFDYTNYGDPIPHHVRDFRVTAHPSGTGVIHSPTYGEWVFRSADRDEARAMYERLTRRHLAEAAVRAALGLK